MTRNRYFLTKEDISKIIPVVAYMMKLCFVYKEKNVFDTDISLFINKDRMLH